MLAHVLEREIDQYTHCTICPFRCPIPYKSELLHFFSLNFYRFFSSLICSTSHGIWRETVRLGLSQVLLEQV